MEQTSIEWLIEKFKDLEADFKYSVIDYETYKSKQIDLLEQAKEMVKLEKIKSQIEVLENLRPSVYAIKEKYEELKIQVKKLEPNFKSE